MTKNKIKIFVDGPEISEIKEFINLDGFTFNPSLFKKLGAKDYLGFTKEILSLLLWIGALIAAISLEHLATPKITEFIGNPDISKIISYLTVFIIFIFLGGILILFITN